MILWASITVNSQVVVNLIDLPVKNSKQTRKFYLTPVLSEILATNFIDNTILSHRDLSLDQPKLERMVILPTSPDRISLVQQINSNLIIITQAFKITIRQAKKSLEIRLKVANLMEINHTFLLNRRLSMWSLIRLVAWIQKSRMVNSWVNTPDKGKIW